jgi:hypothetical protein
MQNNNTFSNRESLKVTLSTLPLNDTFSNRVALQSVLINLGPNDTFSNDVAVSNSIPQGVPPKKDDVGGGKGDFKDPIKDGGFKA